MIKKDQKELIRQVRIAKAEYPDITYKGFAEYIGMTEHGFYNWLNGAFALSREKENKLADILQELLPND